MAAAVFDAASEAIMITDPRPRIQAVNPAFTAVTGYTAAEVIGQDPRMLGSGRQDEAFYQELLSTLSQAGAWQGEVWNRRKDGAFYAVRLSLAAVRGENGPASHFVGIFHDITLRKEDEARAWNRANYDALTGLPNRALLLDRLEQTLSRADRGKDGLAVVFLDLDGFKAVNDSLGHARGDLLLQQVARRLQTCVRAADTVARLAGDEFVAILDQLREPADAIKVARKMLAAMAEPFDLDGDSASVSASIGIAFYPADGDDPLDLLERADVAMYRVKHAGRNGFCFYSESTPQDEIDYDATVV